MTPSLAVTARGRRALPAGRIAGLGATRQFHHGLLAALAWAVLQLTGCRQPPADPLELTGNLLTVHNRTSDEWRDVEIWLNQHFRVTVPTIAAGSRFQAPLNFFVAGFGQRFDFKRMQITALRLTAKGPDGEPIELNKKFVKSGLAAALGKE
jgi:hypothetical protein